MKTKRLSPHRDASALARAAMTACAALAALLSPGTASATTVALWPTELDLDSGAFSGTNAIHSANGLSLVNGSSDIGPNWGRRRTATGRRSSRRIQITSDSCAAPSAANASPSALFRSRPGAATSSRKPTAARRRTSSPSSRSDAILHVPQAGLQYAMRRRFATMPPAADWSAGETNGLAWLCWITNS